MKKLVTLSLAALLLSSTAVLAQSVQTTFDGLDSDGDDKLSYTDLLAQWPDLTQDQFDAADIDGDDVLDLTQFEALQDGMGGSVEVAVQGTVTPAIDVPSFESIDSDGDGKLAFDDLTGWGLSQADFDTADIDSNDFLDTTEYEGLKPKLIAPMAEPSIAVGAVGASASGLPLFEDVDADGDGQIAFSDLKIVLPGVTQEQFDAADIDSDDFLDRTQYEGLEM